MGPEIGSCPKKLAFLANAPARVEHLSVEFVALPLPLPPWNSSNHHNNSSNTKGSI